MYMFIYIDACINNENQYMNMKEQKRGILEVWKEEREGKSINNYVISKIKKVEKSQNHYH